MTYKVARYIAEHDIEVQPGSYFWRRSAAKAAASLNASLLERNVFVAFFQGPQNHWNVFKADVLARALEHAKEEAWKAEDRAERKRRATEFLNAMNTGRPSVLDDVKAGHPETVPAKTVHWLDEDPTDHDGLRYPEPEDTTGDHDEWRPSAADLPEEEDLWDVANGGSLNGGKELPVRIPDAQLPDPTAGMTPEEAEKAWDGVLFIPQDAEPEGNNRGVVVWDAETVAAADAARTAELEKAFQESPIADQVEAFLADPDAGVPATRPARKRAPRKLTADDISF